jgi:hypothetical protein
MAVIVTVTGREEKNTEEDQKKFTPSQPPKAVCERGKFISRYSSRAAKQIR